MTALVGDWRHLVLLAVVGGCCGCVPNPKGFDSPAPSARLEAVLETARERDQKRIPDLITQLGSDDPAVRLFTIRTLERLTGETLGYHYADPEPKRREAIERWIDWYGRNDPAADSGVPTAIPADDTSSESGSLERFAPGVCAGWARADLADVSE